MCSIWGQPCKSVRSPRTTIFAPVLSHAMLVHSSGPIPAGSPEVSAMTAPPSFTESAVLETHFYVSLAAELLQPFLVGVVCLSLAQRMARLEPHALRAHLG